MYDLKHTNETVAITLVGVRFSARVKQLCPLGHSMILFCQVVQPIVQADQQ